MSEQLEELVIAQQDKLASYCNGKFPALNTGVTYYSQRDNYTMSNRTCNSSSNAMYLNWLRLATFRKKLSGDNEYLRKVLTIGDTIEHWVQTTALKAYGFNTIWKEDSNIDLVCGLLKSGFPVVVNILHRGTVEAPRGGHVICLIGCNKESVLTHDPYGTLSSDYSDTNGAYSRIPLDEFVTRWQGGYRLLNT